MRGIKKKIEDAGLIWEAIENFDPAHWHDVLLGGPKKKQQLEGLKTIIRRVGEAGVPIIGYNFSIAGVAGRVTGPFARGGALSVGMEEPLDAPVPLGMAWNMIYDPDAPAGFLPATTYEELWKRAADFLNECLPVAEEAGRAIGCSSGRSAHAHRTFSAASRVPSGLISEAHRYQP